MGNSLENNEELRSIIDKRIKKIINFTSIKLTDTSSDNLMVVSRRYVNLNGTTAQRPTASVVGQHYFDTSIGKPVWWNGSTFVDATGTPV